MLLPRRWKDLSVSKKLYGVVGVMATLIIMELCVLAFVMSILSSVRAFVGGEGLWSKSQKNAVFEIQNFVATRDPKFYQIYLDHLGVPLGDRRARLEMENPQLNILKATEGFLSGRIHPHDIPGMIKLIRRYHEVEYLAKAIAVWKRADEGLDQLILIGDQIHFQISNLHKKSDSPEIRQLMNRMAEINHQLTELEDQFSYTLGEASRWLENTLLFTLLVVVLIIECTGLFLTVRFTMGLTSVLGELNTVANEVGSGNFSKVVPIRSRDELGQLAASLNKMTENLRVTKSEQIHAEEATQIKSLFLANMSHEIRTPLGAILGFVELLKDPGISEQERGQYLNIVERTGNSLATIINDILDISKVEAGKLEVNKTIFNLTHLLRDLQFLLQLRCDEKGIYLKFESLGKVPDMIYTDPIRLRQILLNIVGNAIKFTNKGGVVVSCRSEDDILQFSVSDEGPGISAEDIKKLFKPFSQLDLSIRKVHGGAGLGLVLSRELAQLLGGDVYLEQSQVGQGSIFGIRIALDHTKVSTAKASLPSKSQIAWSDARLDGKTILVVDDSPENQLLIRQYLVKSGAQVELAANGLEGMTQALAKKFDVIVMDMQMPVMDGYAATENLRREGYVSPIVGLTAHAMREDLDRCLQAGCSDVLTKPVGRSQLIDLIERHCG